MTAPGVVTRPFLKLRKKSSHAHRAKRLGKGLEAKLPEFYRVVKRFRVQWVSSSVSQVAGLITFVFSERKVEFISFQ